VRQVQQVVADGGYGVAVDGVWGARTTAAVRAWQQDTGVYQGSWTGPPERRGCPHVNESAAV